MATSIRAATILAAVMAALLIPAAAATTPEEAYLAARDAAIAKIKAASDAEPKNPSGGDEDKIIALDDQARADLERQMRAIVGPVAIEGLQDKGALNLETLIEGDEDFGLLDGMVFGPLDAKTRVIVTTGGLFRHWLGEHKDWWGKDSPPLPQEPGAAVRDTDFYTQAVLNDAAIVRFGDLAIRPPAKAAFAYAMLASRTQSDVPSRADEIFITLMQSGRVFIAYSKDFHAVGPIPACEAIRKNVIEKAQQPGTTQSDPGAIEAEADAKFLSCFAAEAPQQAGFAAAVKAAQALLDRLPVR